MSYPIPSGQSWHCKCTSMHTINTIQTEQVISMDLEMYLHIHICVNNERNKDSKVGGTSFIVC